MSASPPAGPQIDENRLRERVQAERMHQFMVRERLTAASGALPSAYVASLTWGVVEWRLIAAWWLALLLVDLATVAHTSRYLRQPRDARARGAWLWRQLGLQTLAGLVWGCVVPLVGQAGHQTVESDVGLVLMTVNAVAVIGLLPFRRAVLAWTAGVWTVPMLYFLLSPSTRHLQLGLGIAVLVVSLNFYLWRASAQLVDGLEKRFRADALAEALHSAVERIRELATRDELTGVFNRRHGMAMLRDGAAAGAGRRQGEAAAPLALLLIDIDWFKRINDGHGHPVGDAVLREVCQRLQLALRAGDVLARIGGEEFMVVLPRTLPAAAAALAERLRAAIAAAPVAVQALRLPVSVSVGLAARGSGEPLEQLLNRADAALYLAKHRGRDQVAWAEAAPGAAEPA